MDSLVRAATATGTGEVFGARARLKSVNYVAGGTAGSIVVRDGGASGVTILDLATPATSDAYHILVPQDGILCEETIHATLTNVTSATFFFE